MRKKIKIFLLSALAVFMLFSCVTLRSPPTSVSASEKDSVYSDKIVAVVYDNSGSMKTGGWSPYAKYALQGLMSIFDSTDTMAIFPLNKYDKDYKKNGQPYSTPFVNVNLEGDRESAIEQVLNHKYSSTNSTFTPSGSTPPYAVENAIDWLTKSGMNKLEPVQGKDFWLIILSDGVFDDSTIFGKTFDFKQSYDLTSRKYNTTGDLLGAAIPDYIGLQTFYFGMGTSAGITESPSLTAKEITSADGVIDAMQEVTNRVTGRYTLDSGITTNGSSVTVDLSGCPFSISSLTVLAQGEGELKLNDVSSPTVKLKKARSSSMSVDEEVTVNNQTKRIKISGCSSIIAPQDVNGYLNKDVVTLTFNAEPTSVSILVEPAIKLQSNLQYKNSAGEWEDVDVDTINTTFKKNELVRTRYKLIDGKTGKNLTSVLNDLQTNVSYAGSQYGYEEGFKLKAGKNEVALSINVKIGDSNYVLYNSWLCDIDENPESFKITSEQTTNGDTVTVKYKTIYDNVQLKKSDFDSNFKWEVAELTDPKGNTVEPISKSVDANGYIVVVYKTEFGQFGSYKNKIKVTRQDNKRYRFGESELNFYPNSLSLSSGGAMTLTTKQVADNINTVEFALTASGQPLSFSSSVLGYELKVDGVDKTKSAKLDGNLLRFAPNSDTLSSQMMNAGERNIELRVWSTNDINVKASASCKLSIIESTYIIEVTEENNKVDIYNVNKSNSKIWYRVNLDGEYLTAKELKDGLDSGEIKLTYNKFGWELLLPPTVTTEVVENGRDAYIVCNLNTSWWKPIASLVGSFIITGDKVLTLSIGNCSNVGVFSLTPVSILSRIWRWVVIILILYTILHIVLWIIGFFVARPLPKGFLIKITLQTNPSRNAYVDSYPINFDFGPKFSWHLKRFIPFKEFMNQPVMMVDNANFYMDYKDQDNGIDLTGSEIMTFDDDTYEFRIIGDASNEAYTLLVQLKDQCRDYSGKRDPDPMFDKDLKTQLFKKLLEDRSKPVITAGTPINVNEEICYVRKDSKGRIPVEIAIFVRSN